MSAPRRVLVTGSASGVGRAIAHRLWTLGHSVVLSDRDVQALAETHDALAATGDAAAECLFHCPLDINDAAAFEQTLAAIEAEWGGLDATVNNAAVTAAGPVMDISRDEFLNVLATNAGGTFVAKQFFGAYFARRGFGRIVNMASLAGQNGGRGTGAHYAASKAAILVLTKVFAREFAADGVTVNAIAPGPLDSPMVDAVVPPEQRDAYLSRVPVGQLGQPGFLGAVVDLLLADDAAFMTGSTLDMNGGLYLR